MSQPLSQSTRAVRAAIATDREHGAVAPPIHLSATFAFEGFGKPRTFDYTRSGNPTRTQLADAIADLEGGAHGIVTSTGMSAVALVLQLLNPGDVIVAAHDCYGGTQRLLRGLAKRGHFEVVFADLTVPESLAIIAARSPRIVWIETPSNPLLRITDIRAVTDAAHAVGAVAVVDNTFLSPALQQPIAHGADVVVHSTTKYLNGHSDVVGGAVVTAGKQLGTDLAWWANALGITGAPFDSYLTLRGIRTLHTRMRAHVENAEAVVAALSTHEAITAIYYPGLVSHRGHEVAARQQSACGAMLSFELRGGTRAVEAFVGELRCFTLAESLGGVESLVAHPATMTHASMQPHERAAAGINDSLVRLSIGVEHADDLIRDLHHALDVAARESAPAHVRVTPRDDRADVILLGTGTIGRELVGQVTEGTGSDRSLRIAGLIDRSGYVFAPDGLTRDRALEICARKRAGQPLSELEDGHVANARESLAAITRHALTRPIVVDATAVDTSLLLLDAVERNCDLVLANKVPLAGSQAFVDLLRETARERQRTVLHEATVGAGLPVIDTLRKLTDAGDDILSIEGCPSGTLGFLFGELGRGVRFSAALARAIERGFTEPDPRVDLSGIDVARKALILARNIGYRGELGDVSVESLVPAAFASLDRDAFVARAKELDSEWEERVGTAAATGRVLRYRARVTPSTITIGLFAVATSDPLGTLTGTDNQFAFTTSRYQPQPLVITGPGAGPAVTAGGVLNDVLHLASRRRGDDASRPVLPDASLRCRSE